MSKMVIGVGHCGFDAPRLARLVEALGGQFCNVSSGAQALEKAAQEETVLILPNRVIGGDQEGGLKVVQALQGHNSLKSIPVMLVSAIVEAQEAAVKAGAVPGIGKDILETEAARDALKPYLAE